MQQNFESSVLGSILISAEVLDRVGYLRPEHFSDKSLGEAFSLLRELAKTNAQIPMAAVLEGLRQNSITADPGKWLDDCGNVSVHTEFYAQKVLEEWQRRQISEACGAVLRDCDSSPVADLKQRLAVAAELTNAGGVAVPTAKEVARINREFGFCEPVKTGFASLDGILGGGFAPQSLTVFGAATSVGKSQLAISLMLRATRNGKPARVLLISQEMNAGSIEDRCVAVLSGLPQGCCRALRRGEASDGTLERFGQRYAAGLDKFVAAPLQIFSEGAVTPIELELMVSRHAKTLDLVIVDYLQQMLPRDPRMSIREKVEDASATCKRLASRHNLAVVGLAQLSREGSRQGHGDEGRPKLWHLRESGAIEQDADAVGLLWRPRDPEAKAETLEIDVAKNRHGACGLLKFDFSLPAGTINEMARAYAGGDQ